MGVSLPCGEAIVESLVVHGVEVVFGIPGIQNLAIYDHLARHGLRHVTPRHEQGAGYAADGYARVTGRPGVCLVTAGPGVTNVGTAAATAYHDSIPLLVISPGMPSNVEGRDAGYLHQVKAQSRAMDSLVLWSRRVGSADEAQEALHDAFQHFAAERPRPVHVEIPLDVLSSDRTTQPIPTYKEGEPPAPDAGHIRDASGVLARSRRPGMILGGGSIGATAEVRELAERLDAIVATTCTGKGAVPEAHSLSLGATIRVAATQEALAGCDVVLAVGTELGEADLWVPRLELPGDVVRVDIDPAQLDKNATARASVLGDAACVLRALLTQLPETLPPREESGGVRVRAIRRRIREDIESETEPYRRLHEILMETLGPELIVAGDSSKVTYFGTVNLFTVDRPRRFLYPVGYSTLGYGIPGAIGAKVAEPERPVVALLGDGAAMFSIAEVTTAAQMRLGIPIIIVNDGGYGQIRDAMRARGSAPVGVDLESPNFPLLGRSLGGDGVSLRRIEDLSPVLEAAQGYDRPTIIELPSTIGA